MQTPNQQLLKTDLLVVTAHPDDESMVAASLARYADAGKVVSLVACTRGEGGGNGTGKELGAALGVVREAELRRCLEVLGVKHLYFLNQPDWAYTESVRATLAKWGSETTLARLVRLVRQLRPEVVVTMDPTPVGGQHGHHQAAGRLATEAFSAAADPTRFPEQLRDEGLETWKVKKLYWTGFQGGSLQIPTEKRYAERAVAAESNHRSQGFDKFVGGSGFLARPNSFTRIKSRVATPTPETDLFDGCDAPAGAERPVIARPSAAPIGFQPLPAWRDFDAWLMRNGLAARIVRPLPTAALTVGRASPVVVEAPAGTDLGLILPDGWPTVPRQRARRATTTFSVTPPAGIAPGRYPITIAAAGARPVTASLDVLPATVAVRLAHPLPVDADPQKWLRRGIAPVAIPHTSAAQGSVRDDREHSGRFFVAYDARGLQALVEVVDDAVVFNIAPDDIKGHWRSTSAELCLDPEPRAEHTFGTLKLGIFPQDATGRVRACRDADANPGPIDRVEPTIQLASRRTPTGYTVEARIPWTALRTPRPFVPAPGRAVGWNVVLYHAGKTSARVGEDVGKSRLAWSFGPGVWGRPEIWGTLVLE